MCFQIVYYFEFQIKTSLQEPRVVCCNAKRTLWNIEASSSSGTIIENCSTLYRSGTCAHFGLLLPSQDSCLDFVSQGRRLVR